MILALPVSAFAESFTVTTNKDIYTSDEKVIIVGVIPEDAPDGYAVLVKVTGQRGDCAAQNILPGADSGFRSRPVSLDECGFGQFTVSAFYADLETSSTFAISNSSQAEAGSKLELRTLKNVMLQALDVVNTRVKELIESGYVLPNELADKYSEGVSEASLALQAIEFGDAAEAKKHMIFALRDFREVMNAFSDEDLAKFEQTDEQQAASDSNSRVVGTYNWLQRYYYRLVELAEKNEVDKDNQFGAAALLLANARKMADDGNFEGAKRNLERVNSILEEIRADLIDDEEEEKTAADTNSTSQKDEKLTKKLTEFAAKYERKAIELLNKTGSDTEAQTKIQDALSLITNATINIEMKELGLARAELRVAYTVITEVEKALTEDEDGDDKTSTSDGGEDSDDDSRQSSKDGSEGSDNGGSGNDDEDKDNKGSDKGSNDEEDQ